MIAVTGTILEVSKHFCMAFLLLSNGLSASKPTQYLTSIKNPITYNETNDPHGIREAAASLDLNVRLINCSKNPDCSEHPEALFSIAVAMFQSKDPNWPEYNYSKQEALDFLLLADKAGHPFAANEIGLIYMDEPEHIDLQLSEKYLLRAFEQNDFLAASNLAKLTFKKSPDDIRQIIQFLKHASNHEDPRYKIEYMLGLQTFGNEEEQMVSAKFFRENEFVNPSIVNDFNDQFGLSQILKD